MAQEVLFDLKGKVALVTGATGLLGKEHCKALASAGARVVVADLNLESCLAFAHELEQLFPQNHIGLALNVTNDSAVQASVHGVLEEVVSIDVLVNNAAMNDKVEGRNGESFGIVAPVDYPTPTFNEVLNVNVTGVLRCIQAVGRSMIQHGGGSIINIASTYGVVAPRQDLYVRPDGSRLMYKSPAYSASKAAVIALTQYFASAWGEYGVRVNALSPGGVDNAQEEWFVKNYTQHTALRTMAQPHDYRGAVVFLASHASRYMTGANLIVDGGWTAM